MASFRDYSWSKRGSQVTERVKQLRQHQLSRRAILSSACPPRSLQNVDLSYTRLTGHISSVVKAVTLRVIKLAGTQALKGLKLGSVELRA